MNESFIKNVFIVLIALSLSTIPVLTFTDTLYGRHGSGEEDFPSDATSNPNFDDSSEWNKVQMAYTYPYSNPGGREDCGGPGIYWHCTDTAQYFFTSSSFTTPEGDGSISLHYNLKGYINPDNEAYLKITLWLEYQSEGQWYVEDYQPKQYEGGSVNLDDDYYYSDETITIDPISFSDSVNYRVVITAYFYAHADDLIPNSWVHFYEGGYYRSIDLQYVSVYVG